MQIAQPAPADKEAIRTDKCGEGGRVVLCVCMCVCVCVCVCVYVLGVCVLGEGDLWRLL
jgi:hypothetical protein